MKIGRFLVVPHSPAWFSIFLALLCLGLAVLLSGCVGGGDQSPRQLKRATFVAGYKAQANLPFVGVYVAQEKGFFRQQGLDLDIKHSTQGEHLQLIAGGHIEFSTATAQSVLKRRSENNVPMVALALLGQRGDQSFIALKDAGIQTPKAWEGKTIGYKVFPSPEYLAILKSNNVDRSKIREVSVGFDPRILTERRVDVLPVFTSNEPDTLRRLGFELQIFDPADYGVPSLGLTYITHQDVIQRDPDLVERFLKAALKGVAFARERPQEALDIVMKFAPQEDRAHQQYMLEVELRNAESDLTRRYGLGWTTEQQWAEVLNVLLEFDSLKQRIDVRTAFADQFLRQIYRQGELIWP